VFHFEINHNFESYQNMQIILGSIVFYRKLQLFYICHLHYTPFTPHLHVVKNSLNFEIIIQVQKSFTKTKT